MRKRASPVSSPQDGRPLVPEVHRTRVASGTPAVQRLFRFIQQLRVSLYETNRFLVERQALKVLEPMPSDAGKSHAYSEIGRCSPDIAISCPQPSRQEREVIRDAEGSEHAQVTTDARPRVTCFNTSQCRPRYPDLLGHFDGRQPPLDTGALNLLPQFQ